MRAGVYNGLVQRRAHTGQVVGPITALFARLFGASATTASVLGLLGLLVTPIVLLLLLWRSH